MQTEAPETIPAMQQMLEETVAAQTAALHAQIAAAQLARTPAPVTLVARPIEIPSTLFLQHIAGMQQHYTTTTTPHVMYTLPAHLIPAATLGAHPTPLILAHPIVVSAGAKAIDAALERIHAATLAAVKNHANALVAAAAHAESTKMTTAQFTAHMNALREKDKQSARAQLDKVYATLGDLGNQHPDQRARILQTANHGGSFLAKLAAEMQQISHDVETKAAAAMRALVSPVKAAAQAAGHWAAGAVKSVGSFFSHLF